MVWDVLRRASSTQWQLSGSQLLATFASGNPIYGLILNGMKGLYTRIGRHYFANPEARSLALGFYHKLSALCSEGAHDQVYETVRRYGHESGEIWHRMQKNLPGDLAIQGR